MPFLRSKKERRRSTVSMKCFRPKSRSPNRPSASPLDFQDEVRLMRSASVIPVLRMRALDGFSLTVSQRGDRRLGGAFGQRQNHSRALAAAVVRPQNKGMSAWMAWTCVRLHRSGERRHIGFVTQDPLLFNDTVAANIALFDPEAST